MDGGGVESLSGSLGSQFAPSPGRDSLQHGLQEQYPDDSRHRPVDDNVDDEDGAAFPTSPSLSTATVRQIAFQLVKCAAFLHNQGMIHADLKPENVLLVSLDACEEAASSCRPSGHDGAHASMYRAGDRGVVERWGGGAGGAGDGTGGRMSPPIAPRSRSPYHQGGGHSAHGGGYGHNVHGGAYGGGYGGGYGGDYGGGYGGGYGAVGGSRGGRRPPPPPRLHSDFLRRGHGGSGGGHGGGYGGGHDNDGDGGGRRGGDGGDGGNGGTNSSSWTAMPVVASRKSSGANASGFTASTLIRPLPRLAEDRAAASDGGAVASPHSTPQSQSHAYAHPQSHAHSYPHSGGAHGGAHGGASNTRPYAPSPLPPMSRVHMPGVRIQITDMGNAVPVDKAHVYFDDFEVQSLPYRAPEVLARVPFGPAIDMWSIGVILVELLRRDKPNQRVVHGRTPEECMAELDRLCGQSPQHLSSRHAAASSSSPSSSASSASSSSTSLSAAATGATASSSKQGRRTRQAGRGGGAATSNTPPNSSMGARGSAGKQQPPSAPSAPLDTLASPKFLQTELPDSSVASRGRGRGTGGTSAASVASRHASGGDGGRLERLLRGCDRVAVEFVTGLVEIDPTKRLDAKQALLHRFFAPLFPFQAIFGEPAIRLEDPPQQEQQQKAMGGDEGRRSGSSSARVKREPTDIQGHRDKLALAKKTSECSAKRALGLAGGVAQRQKTGGSRGKGGQGGQSGKLTLREGVQDDSRTSTDSPSTTEGRGGARGRGRGGRGAGNYNLTALEARSWGDAGVLLTEDCVESPKRKRRQSSVQVVSDSDDDEEEDNDDDKTGADGLRRGGGDQVIAEDVAFGALGMASPDSTAARHPPSKSKTTWSVAGGSGRATKSDQDWGSFAGILPTTGGGGGKNASFVAAKKAPRGKKTETKEKKEKIEKKEKKAKTAKTATKVAKATNTAKTTKTTKEAAKIVKTTTTTTSTTTMKTTMKKKAKKEEGGGAVGMVGELSSPFGSLGQFDS